FYSSGRYYHSDGWLGGINTFTMYGDSVFNDLNGNLIRDLAEPFEDLNGNGLWDSNEMYTDLGNDSYDEGEPFIDCGVDGLCPGDEDYLAPDFGEGDSLRSIFEPFTDIGNGRWDSQEPLKTPEFKAMNWRDKWSLQSKFTYRLSPNTKIKLNTIFSREKYQNYDHNRQMTQDGRNTDYMEGEFIGLNLSHSISPETFFIVNISQNRKKFESYLFEDSDDPRYSTPAGFQEVEGDIFPKSVMQQWADSLDFLQLYYSPQESFSRWGISRNRFMRETTSKQYKFDLTSQFNKYNQIKMGFDYQDHRLELDDFALIDFYRGDMLFSAAEPELFNIPQILREEFDTTIHGEIPSWIEFWNPSRSYYLNKPKEFSAYIQDKIEYGDMILNFGIRYDYFDPNTYIPTNPHEPYFFDPRNPMLDTLLYQGKFDELFNINWGDTSHYVVSIDGQDTTYFTYADFGNYPDVPDLKNQKGWLKKTTEKSLFSPRLGIAYPISDRGVIHFSYGYFFQIPNFDLLYTNPGYKTNETGNIFGIYGNPDLEPQKTLSYELGLQQELSPGIKLEVTGYYRDVRDWVSTGVPIALTNVASYYTYVNKDYSNVRGVIFTLYKRFSQHYSWHLDYTYQIAEGSNSAPDEEWGAIQSDENREPTRMIIPLDWDQTHTLNANLFVGNDNSGGTLLLQFGTGYPYTPEFVQGVNSGQNIATSLVLNSRRKPYTFNIDLKLYRDFNLVRGDGRLFINVHNLLDTRNEITVYGDT
ncbi:MAG: TonB-dependent receptor plug domain-containing protein, partial [Fidelibacterota bacterium]